MFMTTTAVSSKILAEAEEQAEQILAETEKEEFDDALRSTSVAPNGPEPAAEEPAPEPAAEDPDAAPADGATVEGVDQAPPAEEDRPPGLEG